MDNHSQYLLICFIAIVIGMGCILYAALWNIVRKMFLKKGEIVQAFVYDVEPVPRAYLEVNEWGRRYPEPDKVTIRFTTKKQEWITVDLDSSSSLMIRYRRQYKSGDKIMVIYQPDNPYDFQVVRFRMSGTEQLVFGIAGLVFIAVGIYFLLTAP